MSTMEPVRRPVSSAITRPAPLATCYPTSQRGLSPTRYRLDVLAPSVLGAVQSVGGWLFDHAMAGWEVTVLLIDREDSLPLKILGAEVLEPGAPMTSWLRRGAAHQLALAGDLLDRDDIGLAQSFTSALRQGLAQVAVWGGHLPAQWATGLYEVRYEMSVAARAFKAQALAAAGSSEHLSSGGIEIFGYASAGGSPGRRRPRTRSPRARCE